MSGMRLPIAATLILFATAFAGCLEDFEPEADGANPTRTIARTASKAPVATGDMTLEKNMDEVTTGVCPAGIQIPPQQEYCAYRTVHLRGTLSQVSELPVSLDSFVGDVTTKGSDEDGKWNMTIVVHARGDSEAQARAGLDNVAVTWSHKDGDGHHLAAEAHKVDQDEDNQERAYFYLIVPRSLDLYVDLSTSVGDVNAIDLNPTQVSLHSSTGDVTAKKINAVWMMLDSSTGEANADEFSAKELIATTSTGRISLSGSVTQADIETSTGSIALDLKFVNLQLDTSTGDIAGKLTPTATGSIQADSSSGDIELSLPEGTSYGYSIDGSTSTGSVDINLKDGERTGDEEQAHFVTSGFSKRSIRVTAELDTSTADVVVTPA